MKVVYIGFNFVNKLGVPKIMQRKDKQNKLIDLKCSFCTYINYVVLVIFKFLFQKIPHYIFKLKTVVYYNIGYYNIVYYRILRYCVAKVTPRE